MNTQCKKPSIFGTEPFIGGSRATAELQKNIRKAAEGNWTALIYGESGTGKGLAAREIHRLSRRAGRPFVIVNCGAIPDNLIESELFGYERGAFTGADRQRKGKFEAAHGGTIFLDEIGELSLLSQARLLHVLQDREIERLGGEGRRIPIDVRVIAATNRDLKSMVTAGTFRQDLYFRLSVLALRTPTLRERPEDIPLLAQHFAKKAISPEALRALQSHTWPGNVRELDNVIQRAVAVGEADEILTRDLPADFACSPATESTARVRNFHEALEETARNLCVAAFKAARGNCIVAAGLLGLHRNSVYRLIRKYRLEHLLDIDSNSLTGGRQC
jgi:transcriptional regulator with PAS, ATPase and Fis domain